MRAPSIEDQMHALEAKRDALRKQCQQLRNAIASLQRHALKLEAELRATDRHPFFTGLSCFHRHLPPPPLQGEARFGSRRT